MKQTKLKPCKKTSWKKWEIIGSTQLQLTLQQKKRKKKKNDNFHLALLFLAFLSIMRKPVTVLLIIDLIFVGNYDILTRKKLSKSWEILSSFSPFLQGKFQREER